jgi:phosphoserine phosphatase
MSKPLYIFDLDGTLALIHHRRHFVEDKKNARWPEFYAACDRDVPNKPVIDVMRRLRESGAEVWIFSGRSDEVRDKTVQWLALHTPLCSWEASEALTMREEGDHTPDDELKRSWYEMMLVDDRQRLVATFDDRDRVVRMWRDAGVTCFQVAPGDF